MALEPVNEASQLVERLNELYRTRGEKEQSDVNQRVKDLVHQLSARMAEIHDPSIKREILGRLEFQLEDWDILGQENEITELFRNVIQFPVFTEQIPPDLFLLDLGILDTALDNLHAMAVPAEGTSLAEDLFPGLDLSDLSTVGLDERKEPTFELSDQEHRVLDKSQQVLNKKLLRVSEEIKRGISSIESLDLLFKQMVSGEISSAQFQEAVKKLPPDVRFLFESISPLSSYFEFQFALAKAKHVIVNFKLFTDQSQMFLCQNKTKITELLIEVKFIDPNEEIEITCRPLSNSSERETHNGGKSPLLVIIRKTNGEEKFLILKPRSALIEKRVLDVCEKLNRFELFSNLLPHYFIFSFQQSNNEWNWESCDLLGDCSLWEYIDGTDLRSLGCPPLKNVDAFLGSCDWLEEKELEALKRKYTAMKSVFKHMHLTDLHSENFMIKGVKLNPGLPSQRKEEILKAFNRGCDPNFTRNDLIIDYKVLDLVPIDLECVDILSKLPEKFDNVFMQQLSTNQDMVHVISGFNKNVPANPVRYIILGTQQLSVLISNFADSEKLINEIEERVGKRFQTVYVDKIKEHIELSYFYGDVLYFTVLGDELYYGDVCEEPYLIAQGFNKNLKKGD